MLKGGYAETAAPALRREMVKLSYRRDAYLALRF